MYLIVVVSTEEYWYKKTKQFCYILESCVRYLIVVVSTEEYRYEGQPHYTGGVHREAYVPAAHSVKNATKKSY